MGPMAESITNASLRALKPRAQAYEITDARLPGFVVRVLPSGKKVFFVRHRPRGRDERVRLGLWSDTLSLDEARRQAMVILAGQPVASSEDDRDAEDDEPEDVRPARKHTRGHDDREPTLEAASARRRSSPRPRATTSRRAAPMRRPTTRAATRPTSSPSPAR